MTPQDFIAQRPYLVWYVKNPKNLSTAAILEAVLNHGDFDDVKKLFSIIGLPTAAKIFRRQIQRQINNYDPKIAHYFKLYFQKYVN